MKIKKILSLLASLAMAVTAVTGAMTVSVVSAADSYVTSGKIGENASWVINTDGVLVVSGTGDIARPSDGWRWNGHDIDEVVIEDGITSVTASANQQLVSVSGCANIYKITMPPSFKKLSGCIDNLSIISGLTDIYIYSTNITDTAYQSNNYPSGITWHVYKDSETDKSLRNDLGLTDEDIEYIPDNEKMPTVDKTPAQVEPLTETSGPAGLTSKWEWNESSKTLTFSGKGAISMLDDFRKYAEITEHIIINSGITRIGKVTRQGAYTASGAFEGFTAFKDVQLPDTLVQIGDKSFSKLPLEGELSLPSSLKKIGMYAFEETNITSINSLKPGMTIGAFAFQKCNLLTEITIPQNIVYGKTGSPNGNGSSCSPFSSCLGLEKVVIEGGGSMPIMGGGVLAAEKAIPYALCPNCTSLKIVIIKGNVEYIAQMAFKGCTSLTDIYLYNTDLKTITAKGANNGYNDSIDTTNNPTFHVIKGSKTEQTLKNAGYLTDDNTVYLADTTALETAIADADAIDTSKYTDETVSALTTAVENAKAVLENLDATQEEVDKAATAIETAIKALKLNNSSNSQQQTPNKTTPQTPTTARPQKSTRSAAQVKKDKSAAKKAMKQAKITKLTAKSKAKKKITVSWKKVKNAKGYQVQVSAKKNFKKVIYNKSLTKNKLTIKSSKIKSKKTYYVKVRAYATYKDANNATKKIYSKWVKKIRKVKVK